MKKNITNRRRNKRVNSYFQSSGSASRKGTDSTIPHDSNKTSAASCDKTQAHDNHTVKEI